MIGIESGAVFMTKFYLIILLSDPQIAGFDPEVGSCCNCLGNSHSSILGEKEGLVIFCIAAHLEYFPCCFVF